MTWFWMYTAYSQGERDSQFTIECRKQGGYAKFYRASSDMYCLNSTGDVLLFKR